MEKLYKEIRYHNGSQLYQLFTDLIGYRIQVIREKNDNAPAEEVVRNQGAISELKRIQAMLIHKSS